MLLIKSLKNICWLNEWYLRRCQMLQVYTWWQYVTCDRPTSAQVTLSDVTFSKVLDKIRDGQFVYGQFCGDIFSRDPNATSLPTTRLMTICHVMWLRLRWPNRTLPPRWRTLLFPKLLNKIRDWQYIINI